MKKKVLLGLAAIGIASAMTARAHAGVSFDVHIGFPLPPIPGVVISSPAPCPPPVIVAPRPVCPPPVVVVRPPVPVCPPPVVVSHPVGHPRFIPPGHAKRYAYDHDYHHARGRGHERW